MKKYCLALVSSIILSCFLSFEVYYATCFLPDCQLEEKRMHFKPDGADDCLRKGYIPTPDLSCPAYTSVEECPENDYYVRCNQERWCRERMVLIRVPVKFLHI